MIIKQIIFPSKPKSTVVTIVGMDRARLIFETVYCSKKEGWVSMVVCLKCDCSERKLEDILEDGMGC